MPLKNPVLLDPSQKILSGTGGGRGTIILDSDQIICLRKIIKKDKKKKEINASKICSPFGKFAERAKTAVETKMVVQALMPENRLGGGPVCCVPKAVCTCRIYETQCCIKMK